jgi:hypothetical protein
LRCPTQTHRQTHFARDQFANNPTVSLCARKLSTYDQPCRSGITCKATGLTRRPGRCGKRFRRYAAPALVEQAVRAAHPEPRATQAAREAVRAATALLNRPAAKAVRPVTLLLNRPAVRAKIALIPQGPELGRVPRRGACADRATRPRKTKGKGPGIGQATRASHVLCG